MQEESHKCQIECIYMPQIVMSKSVLEVSLQRYCSQSSSHTNHENPWKLVEKVGMKTLDSFCYNDEAHPLCCSHKNMLLWLSHNMPSYRGRNREWMKYILHTTVYKSSTHQECNMRGNEWFPFCSGKSVLMVYFKMSSQKYEKICFVNHLQKDMLP